ncbi:AMP-binding protein [Pulveribacter sp.]|uniref:AMP-binding protein n=1 Tax=Pulveribacter sp. TaxID=2678893 RepID=UPI0028A62DF1|nr:AMP-binding protein [Pulveribacter sp.]
MSGLPLVGGRGPGDILAWRPQGPVSVARYCADALALAAALPPGRYIVNLCEDRYHYAVLLAACALSGRVSLQPSSQSEATLRQLACTYAGALAVTDASTPLPPELPAYPLPSLQELAGEACADVPHIAQDTVVAILFTSGSTGMPQPHAKTWGKLVANGRAEAQALGLLDAPHTLVGTVPAQHSYGFESTFLLALHGGCSFWSGKPFYPQDLADALAAVPQPAMVVTTPYHLASVLASGVALPPVARWLSATAPLDMPLAAQAEAATGAPVHEIYGSTESSQLATRRTTAGAEWTLMPGVRLEQEGDTTWASGGHVEGRVALADILALQEDGRFTLQGRHADMVNLAGKRTSLAYLNHQLRTIPGVQDGAFFLPDEEEAARAGRLVAFAVAPAGERAAVLAVLRTRIDPIFMPRPLVLVEAIARNATGKIARSTLEALHERWIRNAR